MAEELEKTCENCEYEHEDMEGTHCRHCIHNAEEHFEPKINYENYTEKLVNAVAKTLVEAFENLTIEDVNMYQIGYCKAIDDFVERITLPLTEEDISRIVDEMKGGAV